MAKRKQIGLIFKNDENWTGGIYYILNLIHALNTLPDNEKPLVTVITEDASGINFIAANVCYPYLKCITGAKPKYYFPERVINKFSRLFLSRNIIDKRLKDKYDILFPNVPPNKVFFSKN